MKEIAACGANCTDCKYSNQCEGCNALNGIPFGEQEKCSIFQCASQKQLKDCSGCTVRNSSSDISSCSTYKTIVSKKCYERNLENYILRRVNRNFNIKYRCFKDITETINTILKFKDFTDSIVKLDDKDFSEKLPVHILYNDEGFVLETEKGTDFHVFYNKNKDTFSNYNPNQLFINCKFNTEQSVEIITQPFRFPMFASELKSGIKEMSCGKPQNYFRAVFELNKIPKFDFKLFDSRLLEIVNGNSSSLIPFSLMNCKIEDYEFEIFKNDDYFFIDSVSPNMNEEVFKECIEAILIAIGFFEGYFIQKECYIISSKVDDFSTVGYIKYKSLMNSIISKEPAILTSEIGLNSKIFNDKDASKESSVSENIFNNFLAKVYGDKEENKLFQEMLFIMFYGTTYSLDTQPICFSVLFEECRNYLENTDDEIKNNQYIKTVKSEQLKKDIYENVKDIIDGKLSKILVEVKDEKEKIKSWIANLFKRSNNDLLIEPLIKYGIVKEENKNNILKIINYRNSFLHGRQNSLIKDCNSPSEECITINSISFQQYALFYMLILKIIGYKGYVLNYEKYSMFLENKDYCTLPNMIEI